MPIFLPLNCARSSILSLVDHRVGNQIVPTAEGDHRHALDIRLHQSGRRAGSGVDVAGDQRLIGRRLAVDPDDLGFESVLLKKASLVSDEDRIRNGGKKRHADADPVLAEAGSWRAI